MKISICIPMYNESKIIAQSITTLSEYMNSFFEDYEIIVSNDGSTDGCDKIVKDLNLPNVILIGDSINRGKGYAVRNAMLTATGDIRIFTDSDLAYGVEVIEAIVKKFEGTPNADMLIGSRVLHKNGYAEYTLLRKIASKIYIKVLCIAGGFKLSDSQCGCKAYSKKSAELIFPKCTVNGFAFDFETILWANKLGMKIIEMPIKIINHGESKVNVIRDTMIMLKDLSKIKKQIRRSENND